MRAFEELTSDLNHSRSRRIVRKNRFAELIAQLWNKTANMDKLPLEVLVQILSYVPPFDRVSYALVCKRWAQALSTSTLLKDVWLHIDGGAQMKAAEAALMGSQREYRNSKLSKVEPVDYNAEFWTGIGKTLRELVFERCSCAPQVFAEILRACPRLESLKMLYSVIAPRGKSCLKEVQGSFGSIRHVELPWLSEIELLADFLRLMPNVASMAIPPFLETSDFLSRFPSLCGPSRVITELHLGNVYLDEEWINFMKQVPAGIRVLRLWNVRSSEELCEIIGECKNLRVLELRDVSFNDELIKKIFLGSPGLEDLSLSLGLKGPAISIDGFAPMFQLKKLRKLNLLWAAEEFLWSLGTVQSLQYLILEGSEHSPSIDVRSLRSIASLPNLQTLIVKCHLLGSSGLRVILRDFKQLRDLKLLGYHRLTEEDFLRLRHFERLRTFKLTCARHFTDLAVAEGLTSPDLESLELVHCSLTDAGLASIGARHRRLRCIYLINREKITEAGLITLLQHEPRLEILELGEIEVTEKFFNALAEFCPRLRRLRCAGPDRAKESFKKRRPAVSVHPVIHSYPDSSD